MVASRGEDDNSTSSSSFLSSKILLDTSDDVSSVEIHRNDGYTSDTVSEKNKHLINEIHRDIVVERSTLSPLSTTSSSICDFVPEVDDNFTILSGRLSFSNPLTLSTA